MEGNSLSADLSLKARNKTNKLPLIDPCGPGWRYHTRLLQLLCPLHQCHASVASSYPGFLETWDPNRRNRFVHIVFCLAYCYYPWSNTISRMTGRDNFLCLWIMACVGVCLLSRLISITNIIIFIIQVCSVMHYAWDLAAAHLANIQLL